MSVFSSGARKLTPRRIREYLYEALPGRRRRWAAFPGVQTISAGGHIALTFDDGPDPDCTPMIVRALELAHARATFFVSGEQVVDHPDVLLGVIDAGHDLGLHGFKHLRLDGLSEAAAERDVRDGLEAIRRVTEVPVRWFRPPYGRMCPGADRACKELGMVPVYWSAWGHDWEPIPPERILDVARPSLVDGAVLLLHDSARYARRRTADATVGAIPLIAAEAQRLGLALVSLGDAP